MNATTYGVDIAKTVFQVHWVEPDSGEIHSKKLSRAKFIEFFARRQAGCVAIEACGGAHHWAKALSVLGHRVELLPARQVRAFVTANKDDAADARGLWLAAQHQASPMRLMFTNPRVVTLETRVPAMGIPPRNTPGLLVAIEERRITHLLTQPDSVSQCLQRLANALPREFPERFEQVYANPSFQVYRVVPSGVPFDGAYKKLRWGEQQRCDFS